MICDISYEILIGSKLLRIRLDKIDGIIRTYDGTRHLTLFSAKKYDAISNRVRYLIILKSRMAYIFSHYFVKIKVDSCDSLHIEKNVALHNVLMVIKSVIIKDKNHY